MLAKGKNRPGFLAPTKLLMRSTTISGFGEEAAGFGKIEA